MKRPTELTRKIPTKFESLCELGLNLLQGQLFGKTSSTEIHELVDLMQSRDSGHRKIALLLLCLLIHNSEIGWSEVEEKLSCGLFEDCVALITSAEKLSLDHQHKQLLEGLLSSKVDISVAHSQQSSQSRKASSTSPVIYHFPNGKTAENLQALTKRDIQEVFSSKSLSLCPDPKTTVFAVFRPVQKDRRSASKPTLIVSSSPNKSKSSVILKSVSKQGSQELCPRPRFPSEMDPDQLMASNLKSPFRSSMLKSSNFSEQARRGAAQFKLRAVKPARNIPFTPQAAKKVSNNSMFLISRGNSLAIMESTPKPSHANVRSPAWRSTLELQPISSFTPQIQSSSFTRVDLELDTPTSINQYRRRSLSPWSEDRLGEYSQEGRQGTPLRRKCTLELVLRSESPQSASSPTSVQSPGLKRPEQKRVQRKRLLSTTAVAEGITPTSSKQV